MHRCPGASGAWQKLPANRRTNKETNASLLDHPRSGDIWSGFWFSLVEMPTRIVTGNPSSIQFGQRHLRSLPPTVVPAFAARLQEKTILRSKKRCLGAEAVPGPRPDCRVTASRLPHPGGNQNKIVLLRMIHRVVGGIVSIGYFQRCFPGVGLIPTGQRVPREGVSSTERPTAAHWLFLFCESERSITVRSPEIDRDATGAGRQTSAVRWRGGRPSSRIRCRRRSSTRS